MGVQASLALPAGTAVTSVNNFIYVLAIVYTLAMFAYILLGWIRLPYSIWGNRIQRFLYDVCDPYLRLFRRVLPSFGGLDLSPMVAIFVLWIVVGLILKYD